MITAKTNQQPEVLEAVVIRFVGDSGDGMQLTGTQFSDTSAMFGNDIATFPNYPAEIRAPQGSLYGVSGFQYILPDTSIFKVGPGNIPYGIIPKDITGAGPGDTLLVYTDLDIAAAVALKMDSLGFANLEAAWNRCASRGICEDSVKVRSLP